MNKNNPSRFTLESPSFESEPWGEVVQKIRNAVCKYRNNFSVKTDGTMGKESDTVTKVTITVEIFDINR